MNTDNPKGTESLVSTKKNVRRTFLKRATAGAVITSLPAKSVWGACSVSGAMSGNLSNDDGRHDCPPPEVLGGLSPGAWKEIYDGSNGINGAFNNIDGTTADHIRECYRADIRALIDDPTTVIDFSTAYNSGVTMTLGNALDSYGGGDGSLEFNLAGVWLNAYYGFYEPIAPANSASAANAIVKEILFYIQLEQLKDFNFEYNFNNYFHTRNNTTNYTVDCSSSTPPAGGTDDDGDGVINENDLCPSTPDNKIDRVDSNGCGPGEHP